MHHKIIILLFSPLLFFSCKGEKQWNLSSARNQYAALMKIRISHPIEMDSKDSAYWVGTCWNLYRMTNDSCFYEEAERYVQKVHPVYEDTTMNAGRALQLYLAYGKGFEATGKWRYKHEVWSLGERLLTDSTYIDGMTVEALLWGTAHKGCHCLKEAAIRWGNRCKLPLATVNDVQAFGALYIYTDSLAYLEEVSSIDKMLLIHSTSDSLRIASMYARFAKHADYDEYRKKAIRLFSPLSQDSKLSIIDYYYCSEILSYLEK